MKSKLLKYVRGFCLLFMLPAIWGCTCNCDAGIKPLKTSPKLDFLEGVYALDKWTLSNLQGCDSAQGATIRIKPDRTFEMLDIPRAILDYDAYYKSTNEKINAVGTWTAEYNEGTAELFVNLNFDSRTDLKGIATSWKIYTNDERPVILIVVADPDECAAARFEKISN